MPRLQPSDYLVEVRDANLVRQGSISAEDLLLKFQPVFRGVGSWNVRLPSEHPMAAYLRAPGAGVIITNLRTGMVEMSGSTSVPSKRATVKDVKGYSTIAGLSDDRLLFDAAAYPDPTAPASAQPAGGSGYDVRTGVASTVMRAYVNANIGPAALSNRRVGSLRAAVTIGPDPVLGGNITQRARFDRLGELLQSIALVANLGFRMVQIGSAIQFQVYRPTDRRSFIRLDIANGTLAEQSVEIAAPEVTRMIVLGQGDLAARKVKEVTSPAAAQAEADWRLIIEEVKDQRNTNDDAELIQAGQEELAERGFTKVAVKSIPANDQTMIFMQDFFLGDLIRVVVNGQEPSANITEAAIAVDKSGVRIAVAIGDITDFDRDSAIRSTVADNTQRIGELERNTIAVTGESVAMTGELKMWPLPTLPAGWLLADGSAVSRVTYARLFELYSTTFGAGDGSSTFNLPDMRGRTPAGRDATQTEFNTLGKKSGSKNMPSHTHDLGDAGTAAYPVAWGAAGNVHFDNVQAQAGAAAGNGQFTVQNQWNKTMPAGDAASVNNLPPILVVNFIVKT